MATQLDSLQISQLKSLALGLQHEVKLPPALLVAYAILTRIDLDICSPETLTCRASQTTPGRRRQQLVCLHRRIITTENPKATMVVPSSKITNLHLVPPCQIHPNLPLTDRFIYRAHQMQSCQAPFRTLQGSG